MSMLTKVMGAVLVCSILYPVLDGCLSSCPPGRLFHLKATGLAGLFFVIVALGHLTSNRNG